jgi:hypothetical protein
MGSVVVGNVVLKRSVCAWCGTPTGLGGDERDEGGGGHALGRGGSFFRGSSKTLKECGCLCCSIRRQAGRLLGLALKSALLRAHTHTYTRSCMHIKSAAEGGHALRGGGGCHALGGGEGGYVGDSQAIIVREGGGVTLARGHGRKQESTLYGVRAELAVREHDSEEEHTNSCSKVGSKVGTNQAAESTRYGVEALRVPDIEEEPTASQTKSQTTSGGMKSPTADEESGESAVVAAGCSGDAVAAGCSGGGRRGGGGGDGGTTFRCRIVGGSGTRLRVQVIKD